MFVFFFLLKTYSVNVSVCLASSEYSSKHTCTRNKIKKNIFTIFFHISIFIMEDILCKCIRVLRKFRIPNLSKHTCTRKQIF